jgi:hypothetical protein
MKALQKVLQYMADQDEIYSFLMIGECWTSTDKKAVSHFAKHQDLESYKGNKEEVAQIFYSSPEVSYCLMAPINRLKVGEEKSSFLGAWKKAVCNSPTQIKEEFVKWRKR